MSWTPGWELAAEARAASDSQDARLLVNLRTDFELAGSAEALARVRLRVREALRHSPNDEELLLVAAHVEILHGAAYDERRSVKAESYRRGIQFAERAMATNPEFARRVRERGTLAEAVAVLGEEDAEAMLLWVTGVSYYFEECLSGLGHVLNFKWMKRTSEVMHHLMDIAPDFEHGAIPFSLGIYYLALPASVGGDRERASSLLEQAVSQSGSSLLPRWGRARYLWAKTGNREALLTDLEWVLSQDARTADSPYAWNVYFQRDARSLLDRFR